ncbi:MAG TPA: metalloregulator ArsR/SmtB family transcription factor [Acidimicrobiia bacterium]|nr:metalloregulator ArsR/SmtB family transcription factor [Acidimicrobiia bacterium]
MSAVKVRLSDGFARVAQGLANGRRIELLDLLAQGERPVDEIARALEITIANCSQHLQVLRRAGLVASRRDGNRVWYGLASETVVQLLTMLRDVAFDRSADVRAAAEAYLGGPVEEIDRDELAARLERGEVVLVDVRPHREFVAGHITGALSIPLDELEARLIELPAGLDVVAYCRGRFCAFAEQGVRIIEAAGRRAFRLVEGLPEWRQAGHPVSSAS